MGLGPRVNLDVYESGHELGSPVGQGPGCGPHTSVAITLKGTWRGACACDKLSAQQPTRSEMGAPRNMGRAGGVQGRSCSSGFWRRSLWNVQPQYCPGKGPSAPGVLAKIQTTPAPGKGSSARARREAARESPEGRATRERTGPASPLPDPAWGPCPWWRAGAHVPWVRVGEERLLVTCTGLHQGTLHLKSGGLRQKVPTACRPACGCLGFYSDDNKPGA